MELNVDCGTAPSELSCCHLFTTTSICTLKLEFERIQFDLHETFDKNNVR